jgi:hypothetical protein
MNGQCLLLVSIINIAGLAINPVRVCWTIGHCALTTGSFCVFGPALSSPAHAAASLDMPLRRIEVLFVLWDDLKLTSGLRTPTAFNGPPHFQNS